MATNSSVKNAMTTTKEKKPSSIKDFVNVYQGEIAKALPKVMTPERFARIVTTALTTNPKLSQCSPQSFIGAMLQSAQLGLEPNTPLGQAYLIPYGTTCQFQIGYRGLIELAHRSGEVKNIESHIVYENDEFHFEYGLDSSLKHIPAVTNKGAATWVYAVYKLNNGGYGFEVMSYEEALNHGKKYSKTFGKSPWQTEPEEMAKKTVLKKLLKYAPMKTEYLKGDEQLSEFDKDNSTIDVINNDDAEFAEVVSVVDEQTGEVYE